MNWIPLKDETGLQEIKNRSAEKTQVIFKHSTRCSISSMALNRLERATAPDSIDFNYLDLLTYRDLSLRVANEFSVEHESPQILIIKNGECVYDESHTGISMDQISQQA